MSGPWSLQACPAGQYRITKTHIFALGRGQQPVLLQLPRRSWGVHGIRCKGVPGDWHLSKASSVTSAANGASAAHAAVVASGTTPLLVHVVDSLAYRSTTGTTTGANDFQSKQQQQQQQQDYQQQQLLLHPYVVVPTDGLKASNTGCAESSPQSNNGRTSAGSGMPIRDTTSSSADITFSSVQDTAAGNVVEPLKFHITRCIKRCRSWQEVDVVVREYGPAFNIIHISAAITHLAQLSMGQQQQQQQQPLRQVLQPHHQQLQDDAQLVQGIARITEQMDTQYKQLQWSLQQHGQQQQGHHAQLVQQLLDQALLQLPEAQARQVANMLWALAQLQYPWRESAAATAAVAALTQRAMLLFPSAEARHLSNVAYAAAKLQLPVDRAWLASLQDAWLQVVVAAQRQQQQISSSISRRQSSSSSSRQHSSCSRSKDNSSNSRLSPGESAVADGLLVSPQAAANMLWALVHLQQQPNREWLHQVVLASLGAVVNWPAKSISVFMWACAKLGYHLGALDRKVDSTLTGEQGKGQLGGMNTQQIEQLQLQLQTGRATAHHHQQQQQQQQHERHVSEMLLQAVQVCSREFSYHDTSQMLWALAVMGLHLPSTLLQQLLASGSATLPGQQARRHARVADTGSTGEGSGSNAGTGPAVAHSVALTLYSLASLGVAPQQQLPPLLLRPWMAALLESSHSADSHCLASAADAICKLGLASSCPSVVKALLEAAQSQLKQSSTSLPPGSEAARMLAVASESAVHNPAVSSRAVASLVRAAAYCTLSAAAAATPAQQSGVPLGAPALQLRRGWRSSSSSSSQQQRDSASHREYLRQRQQQQLQLMLQGMQAAGLQQAVQGKGSGSRPSNIHVQHWVDQGGSACSRASAAQAIKQATLQLLLTSAGMPASQPSGVHVQQQQQQQQQVQGDIQHKPDGCRFQPQPCSSSANNQQQQRQQQQQQLQRQQQQRQQQQQQQQRVVVLPGASMMDLSLVLWAAAVMQLEVSKPWWQQCMAQLQQLLGQPQQLLGQPQQAAQSLALSVWALGKAGVLASPELMKALQQASLSLLQPTQQSNQQQPPLCYLTPQGHVMLLVGLVRLCMAAGHQLPAARQSQQQVSAARNRRKQARRHHLSGRVHTVRSSASASNNNSRTFRAAQHCRFQQQQQPMPSQPQQQKSCAGGSNRQFCTSTRATRQAQQRRRRFKKHLQQHHWVHAAGLRPDWLQAYCTSAAQQLASLQPTGLTALLWGLGKLRYHPGTSFMAQALCCVEQHLPQMTARHIALLLWALQRLQHLPGEDLLTAVLRAWEHRLASASKADSQQVHWAQQQIRQMQFRRKWEAQQQQ